MERGDGLMAEWVLLVQGDQGDYYLGESSALYRDGVRIWEGYESEDLIEAILGPIEVRRKVWPSAPYGRGRFADNLADQPAPTGEGL